MHYLAHTLRVDSVTYFIVSLVCHLAFPTFIWKNYHAQNYPMRFLGSLFDGLRGISVCWTRLPFRPDYFPNTAHYVVCTGHLLAITRDDRSTFNCDLSLVLPISSFFLPNHLPFNKLNFQEDNTSPCSSIFSVSLDPLNSMKFPDFRAWHRNYKIMHMEYTN